MDRRTVARLLLAGAAALPAAPLRDAPVLCPFRRVTGRPCPACGLTRSWQAAAHGRARESVAHHPLGLAVMGVTVWWAVDPTAEDRVATVDRRVLALALGLWLATWLWRLRRP
jgi:hypothetical protein